MAEGKKSFVLYSDIIHTVKKLPNNKAGELFKLILSYVNDENPTTKDLAVDLVFEPIKQQLKRDLKQWEETRSERSESGRAGGIKSGEARRSKIKQNEAELQNSKQNEANEAVIVNGIVTVNVTDNVNVFSIERCLEISLADSRWTKANKATKEELEIFNEYLEKIGKYHFVPIDYKKYFSTIKSKYSHMLKKEWSIDELKEMARKMDEENLKLKAV